MRICPYCRAEVNDFDSECEYCGAELPLDGEAASIIEKIENLLSNVRFVLNNQNEKASSIKSCISNIETFLQCIEPLSENKPIAKSISELKSLKKQLEDRLFPLEKKERRRTTVRTIVFSIIAEITLFIVFLLVLIFGKEATENAISIALGIIGIVVGIGLINENFWTGFFSGLIGGVILSCLVNWLVSTPIGQIILLVTWTIGIVSFDIYKLRKK